MSAQIPHPDCPFCAIAGVCPPSTPASLVPSPALSQACNPPTRSGGRLAYMLLSTPHVIAFLDHAPISRGHVLVATRGHRSKLSDVSVQEGIAVGKWLSIVSRAVMMGATGRESDEAEDVEVGNWNVVQNNGTSIYINHIMPWGGKPCIRMPHLEGFTITNQSLPNFA